MVTEPIFEHDESDFDCVLIDAELEVLGDLAGRRVLHLVSGLPFESLALAELGASVLAMNAGESEQDFVITPPLAEMGNFLAQERGLDVEFLLDSLAQLHDSERDARFDLVYAGPTTLAWTDNLHDWAVDASQALIPGGRLVMYDEHPASRALEPDDGLTTEEEAAGQEPLEDEEPSEFEPVDEAWTLDELREVLEGQGLVISRLDELFGPQRFLTTADAVDEETGLPTAFLLVAERPAV